VAHLDPDRLTLLALAEQDPHRDEAHHLVGCADCRGDVDVTRHVVTLARDGDLLRELPPAPVALWGRISAEALGVPAVEARPVALRPALRRTGRRRVRILAAAAALVLGVLGAGGLSQVLSDDGTTAHVVASAELLPQAGAPASAHGRAEVVDTGHGLQVVVSVQGMPTTDGYYTVWIYDGKGVMIPLGSPGSAALNLPAAAADLRVFHIVDVSAQALGQQEHGRSMLQGALT
jgi:hypothetical protein